MTDVPHNPSLSDGDSLMWRIETDPVLRSYIIVVAMLDRPPDPASLRATIDRATADMPQLRQVLVEPALGIGRPTWRDAGTISFDHHVRRVGVAGGGLRDVLDLSEPDVVEPFDPARPLWRLTVVDGLDDGRAAFVLRLHHSITDGVGGMQLAERIFDRTRRPPRRARSAGAPGDGASPDGVAGNGLSGGDRERPGAAPGSPAARAVAASAGAVGAIATRAAAAARHPAATVTGSVRIARSVGRMLAPTPPTASSLLADRGLDRRAHAFGVPLAGLRAAADRVGATLNDVLLSAVAGALATYNREHGTALASARVMMPVSVRSSRDPVAGNRFTMIRFVLPIDDPDPVARARVAGTIVRSWRDEPAIGMTSLLTAGLNALPRAVAAGVFGGLMRSMDVNVSNVPGLARAAYVGGARIDRLYALAPLAGAAFSVTLVSYRGTCGITVTCDTAAVPDPDRIARLVEEGVEEILTLGAPARRGARTGAAAGAAARGKT